MSARTTHGVGESTRLDLSASDPPLIVVVGSGGVGKTTLAAAMGLASAEAGLDTLVMTFDPSRRLKDALGVGDATEDDEVEVALDGVGGSLHASLLDAGATFDRLVARYAPDDAVRDRVLGNRYYRQMAGNLGGILEYMAVERLYEVASEGRYERVILDTPPTAQAIDFLDAPRRVVDFLESGAMKIALRPWFDDRGRLDVGPGMRLFGKGLESFLDRIVGLDLLRDMSEFFLAFEPLFEGFKARAEKVEAMLSATDTRFTLVAGPGEVRIPDTLFFARRLREAGCRLGPIVVNRVHPSFEPPADGELEGAWADGIELFGWLGERHRRGLDALRQLLGPDQALAALPLEAAEPTDLGALRDLGQRLFTALLGADPGEGA